MSILDWQHEIALMWPFDAKTYPELAQGSPPGIELLDVVKHVMLHQMKAVGQLAIAIEPRDRGNKTDDILMRRATRNMLVNALRLCGALGYRAPDLLLDYTDELDGPARR